MHKLKRVLIRVYRDLTKKCRVCGGPRAVMVTGREHDFHLISAVANKHCRYCQKRITFGEAYGMNKDKLCAWLASKERV